MIRVSLFEDDSFVREVLTRVIEDADTMMLVASYENANHVLDSVQRKRPDVVLMDIQMPGVSGIEATRTIKIAYPEIQVLIQTVFEDNALIFKALCAGASGYILKDSPPEEYLKAIVEVYQGGAPMSPPIARKILSIFQERFGSGTYYQELSEGEGRVLKHLVEGKSYKLIADACGISISTVNFHLKNIYRKLHVNSATEAVSKAIREKLV
ncbi:MAG: response regulator [Runella sp.]